MEVRKASLDQELVSPPKIYFHFKKNGKFIADIYDEPGLRTTGEYLIKDSLLSIQSKYERSLWDITAHKNFIIQKQNKEEVILLAYTTNSKGISPKEALTFMRLEKYNTYTPQELKEQYSFTQKDSLTKAAYLKKVEEEKALTANDRYSPIYKGGSKAVKAFIKNNLRYPPDHSERKMVDVRFVVNEEGAITDLKAQARGVPEFYVSEAKRVVQSMPDWEPAIKNGQAEAGNTKLLIIFNEK